MAKTFPLPSLKPHHLERYVRFTELSHEEDVFIRSLTLGEARQLFEQFSRDPWKGAVVAVDGVTIIGQLFLRYLPTSKIVKIYTLTVRRRYHGMGVGRSMVEKAARLGKTQEAHRLIVDLDQENLTMRRFFESEGFIPYFAYPSSRPRVITYQYPLTESEPDAFRLDDPMYGASVR